MYITFGPDSTQLVRKLTETPDPNRAIRNTVSQKDYGLPAIEEYEIPIRGGNFQHSVQGRLKLDRGLY
jgi:hypothetical protein